MRTEIQASIFEIDDVSPFLNHLQWAHKRQNEMSPATTGDVGWVKTFFLCPI